MKTTEHVKRLTCPACKYKFVYSTSLEGDHEPEAGDVTICAECTAFLTYALNGKSLTVRLLTQQEVGDLPDGIRMKLQRIRHHIEREQARDEALQATKPAVVVKRSL